MHPDLRDCYWYDSLTEIVPPREPLRESIAADVAIIGAGYTGLWTAYHLKQLDPSLRVVIVEAEHVGFGASGRNGGWLMGAIEGLDDYLSDCDPETARIARQQVHGIVANAGAVIREEGIDCDFAHGGGVYAAARYPEQLGMARSQLHALWEAGHSESDYRWLEREELARVVRVQGGQGAIYTPHVAAIQPAKLAAGLARAVEARGVKIYENSPVTDFSAGEVHTTGGVVHAAMIVPAIEGFSNELPHMRRYILPFQSGMVVSEPLSADTWAQIGLEQRPVMCDFSRLATYLQRTADDRLAFGARGSYRFGGKSVSQFDPGAPEFAARRELARSFFPVLENAEFTHAWGGTLGIPRRFAPHVVYDEGAGLATAGGYVGEGVGASFLFGQTLAEKILHRESERTSLPWVFNAGMDKALQHWEPEPMRWLGFKAAWYLYAKEEVLYVAASTPPWRKNLARFMAETMERILS